jgi:hypothetical protein
MSQQFIKAFHGHSPTFVLDGLSPLPDKRAITNCLMNHHHLSTEQFAISASPQFYT